MNEWIYLDNAATTRVRKEVVEAMTPYFTEHYGNPSAIYGLAAESKAALEESRKAVADEIGAKANEIYFTAGGSESDNWVLKAVCDAYEMCIRDSLFGNDGRLIGAA